MPDDNEFAVSYLNICISFYLGTLWSRSMAFYAGVGLKTSQIQ